MKCFMYWVLDELRERVIKCFTKFCRPSHLFSIRLTQFYQCSSYYIFKNTSPTTYIVIFSICVNICAKNSNSVDVFIISFYSFIDCVIVLFTFTLSFVELPNLIRALTNSVKALLVLTAPLPFFARH